MLIYQTLAAIMAALTVAACTSDPRAPVNQSFPVRQMDNFFGSLGGAPASPEYDREPGYAPAYPPYR